MIVGYLLRGGFICKKCLTHPEKSVPPAVAVYAENIGQYTQTCPVCREMIVQGVFGVELFGPAMNPDTFCWQDMQVLKDRLLQSVADEDQEAYESIRRTLYERVLRAIMAGALTDRDEIFTALKGIIQ